MVRKGFCGSVRSHFSRLARLGTERRLGGGAAKPAAAQTSSAPAAPLPVFPRTFRPTFISRRWNSQTSPLNSVSASTRPWRVYPSFRASSRTRSPARFRAMAMAGSAVRLCRPFWRCDRLCGGASLRALCPEGAKPAPQTAEGFDTNTRIAFLLRRLLVWVIGSAILVGVGFLVLQVLDKGCRSSGARH